MKLSTPNFERIFICVYYFICVNFERIFICVKCPFFPIFDPSYLILT